MTSDATPDPTSAAHSSGSDPAVPVPDDKDWTWILDRHCPDCGFVADIDRDRIPARILGDAATWQEVLDREDALVRPSAQVWSPSEYACHVRDLYEVFRGRLQRMLTEDNPQFANWDQDETALERRYWDQDITELRGQIEKNANAWAALYESVTGPAWDRVGTRSNGSEFTVNSLALYGLHDVAHHLHDVGAG